MITAESLRVYFVCFILIISLSGCQISSSDSGKYFADTSEGELRAVGQEVYRTGRLLDGRPVKAVVAGGIPLDGTQVTCLNCHRRSGMGGAEGDKFVVPINGPTLYASRSAGYKNRPAYTDESLAKALRTGLDPSGNSLDTLMPVYDLPPLEMSGLIAYLKELSREGSAGVTESDIHLATIIGADIDPDDANAMFAVLERFLRDKNGGTRSELRRKQSGPFFHEYKNKAYRKWVLHRWELTGPPSSWAAQLQAYYRQQPVFALVSGQVKGPWQPIDRFCEKMQIPQLLPNTDQPRIGLEDNFYTLYFSRGLSLEAEVILSHLATSSPGGRVVQVFTPKGGGGYAARELRRAAKTYPQFQIDDQLLPGTTTRNLTFIAEEAVATILWLNSSDVERLGSTIQDIHSPLYLSSTMLEEQRSLVPAMFAGPVFMVHPFNLPEEQIKNFRRFSLWMRARQIPLTRPRIQGQTFYACMLLGEGLMHIKQYFYRDYLLDALDHGDSMAIYANNYPRLSFGPGQRYLAKGAYVLEYLQEDGVSLRQASWVVPQTIGD